MTIGIEMEFWVVDERGRLCDGQDLVHSHDRIEPEFVGPLVEVRTEPHDDEGGLRRDLQSTLRAAIDAADAAGKRLVPLGTPLTAVEADARSPRGRLFEEIYGPGVRSAKNCAGTHVHFEREDTLRQLRLLTALDPALALVSSSPYYGGERGQNSSRAHAYRTECGEPFREFCDLWGYVDSVAKWEGRVERAYERFRELAADRRVDPSRVDEHFTPEDVVLTPVRLREETPTVEWRAPDTALPSQVVRLAVETADLVERTADTPVEVGASGVDADRIGVPEMGRLRALSREAIRWGLDAAEVMTYLDRMGYAVDAYDPIAGQIHGPGSVTEAEARRLRLTYADALETDVDRLCRVPPGESAPGRPDRRRLYA